ncbi:MAG TPA: hypothetical protein VM260_13215 [Pirellula sp.]|nr:hypothetical protein [Pirellula sp.]
MQTTPHRGRWTRRTTVTAGMLVNIVHGNFPRVIDRMPLTLVVKDPMRIIVGHCVSLFPNSLTLTIVFVQMYCTFAKMYLANPRLEFANAGYAADGKSL